MLVKRVVNLCPHDIVIYDSTMSTIRFVYRSVGVARVESTYGAAGTAMGVPVRKVISNEVVGLPAPVEGTLYIVSNIVLSTLHGAREDVVAPDTFRSKVVGEDGKTTVGVTNFLTDTDADFEASTLSAFSRIYKNAKIFRRTTAFSDINPLYLYYKTVVEAGGDWPTLEEVDRWSIVTIDEVVNALVDKEKLYREGSVATQNYKGENYIYSHAEVVLISGKYYIVKDFVV